MGYIILSICITAAAYAAIPLLIAYCGTSSLSAGKYRLYCFLANIIIMIAFLAISGETTGAPYVLYTVIFSSIGVSVLKKRGRMQTKISDESGKLVVKPDMRKFICDGCGNISVSWYSECPNCRVKGKMRRGTDAEICAWNGISYEALSVNNEKLTDSTKFVVKPGMKKFVCDECGAVSVGWYSECPNCHTVGKLRKGSDKEIKEWNASANDADTKDLDEK